VVKCRFLPFTSFEVVIVVLVWCINEDFHVVELFLQDEILGGRIVLICERLPDCLVSLRVDHWSAYVAFLSHFGVAVSVD
jgi:hypothetical protein